MTRILRINIDFRGKQIHYQVSGKGPVIVLLHGFLESGQIWKNFARRLSKSFRIITIDLPGHGLSENPGPVSSMDEMAEAVRHVLKSLNISTCLMVGHSMGGYVTLAFAEKYPRKLKGFILFHSQAAADSAETMKVRERTIVLVEKDHHGFIRNFIPGHFDPSNVKKFGKEIENLKDLAKQTSKEGIISALEGMKTRPDRRHVLAQAKVPVLFIMGKNDIRIPMEGVIPQTLLPEHSETLLLDHVGHMGFIEASVKTYKVIKGFAARILTSVFFLLTFSCYPNFEFNNDCQHAMQAILDLKTNTAREILQKEKSANPENGYTIYLEHYCESIELIVTEDKKIYEKMINSYEDRIKQMSMMDDGSPQYSWLQAEMLFQTGLAQIKFGSRINGISKMISSYKRIKEHRHKYPQFFQNQKLTGIFNLILDNIPPFFRWAADMFGFNGDSVLGMYQLKEYEAKAIDIPGLAEESVIVAGLGYKLIKQEEEGYQFLTSLDKNILDVTLIKYLYANAALFTYRNDLTLKLLSEIHEDELQVSFYALSYVRGRCKLNHLDKDSWLYLESFLDRYPGPDYKKDACNRLSYYYLLEGNRQKYEEYRAKVATVGEDMRDRDREAILESSSTVIPHAGLLKARLLCDGGYFSQADSVIQSIDPDLLDQTAYKLEYHYRKGRIFQLTLKPGLAVEEFNKAFYQGRYLPYTFATRSALQLGKIYEEMMNYPLALQWYDHCLETYNSSHTDEGMEQMAEKSRKRVKEKF